MAVETQRPGERERPLSVEMLVRAASRLLEERIGLVWVEGEVSTLRTPGSGHLYFVLKDGRAQVPAVMWRSTAVKLGFRLEEGARLLVRGKLSVYPEQGRVQLYVEAAEPAGLGAAAVRLAERKKRLEAEGLFDPARKRRLPRFPRRIAVVTSPSGAAVRDILRTIERRYPTPVVIAPCQVQGPGAPADIAWAIRRAGRLRNVDVVIVGRGGGSAEDLGAFNEEPVVRAIVACAVPVISAVGHDIDVTLADLAADARAATPAAAGELAVPVRALLVDELRTLEGRLQRAARHAGAGLRNRLGRLLARLRDPRPRFYQLLVELEKKLRRQDPRTRLAADRARLRTLETRLLRRGRTLVSDRMHRWADLAARLDALSPLKVLDRGYAIARTLDGEVVASVTQAAPGMPLAVRLADGELDVTVSKVRPREE
jgi:exodeoxyribonuclease VII large subunit